jgi:hypothetical protein
MGKKYNYYDTPSNHPEATKYRHWESAILIFGIGVVTTLLLFYYFWNEPDPSHLLNQASSANEIMLVESSADNAPACKAVNMIPVQKRDRLIQLIALSNDLPIENVVVNEIGTVCYDEYKTPTYDVTTDIIVTVGYTPAAKLADYEALGNHVMTLLPPMMQIQADQPRDLVIRFLVGDTYLEWSHSYNKVALYTQGMSGEELWFWAEPDY